MSLGAIDFGLIVDGAVVLVENIGPAARRAGGTRQDGAADHRRGRPRGGRGPSRSAIGIIIIVYLPILTLDGIEGKMFRPMAWTVVFALAGSLLLTLTLTPVLASLFLREDRPRARAALRGLAPRALPARRSTPASRAARGALRRRRRGRWPGAFSPRGWAASSSPGSTKATSRSFAIRPSSVGISEVAAGTGRIERVLEAFPGGHHGGQPLGTARSSPPTSWASSWATSS